MSKVKRKLKNIVRNIMLSETFANTNLVKNIRKNHKEKLEEGRRVLFKEHAKDCLETIKETLDKNNLHFWLDYGTLLGATYHDEYDKLDKSTLLHQEFSCHHDFHIQSIFGLMDIIYLLLFLIISFKHFSKIFIIPF